MFDPTLTSYAIVQEVTPNTIPATPAFKNLDFVSGTQIDYQSDTLESDTQRPDRSLASLRKLRFRNEGSIKQNFKRDTGSEILLLSGMSAAPFASGIAKAGTTETFFTVEKKMIDGATLNFRRFSGCTVTGWTLAGDASGDITITYDILGMGQVTATVAVASSTYALTAANAEATGLDVTSITVAGLTGAQFRKFELKVEHTRETVDAFGSATPIAIGTSGMRKVSFSADFYRKDFSPETVLIPDVGVAVVITINPPGAASGYTFTIPKFVGMVPKDSVDGSKQLVSIEGQGLADTTSGTNLQVTQLA